MDEKQITALVLIDLSKAFDSLCHSTLCKLQYLGESNKVLLWFESYLKIQTDNSVSCCNFTVRTTRYFTWHSSGLNSRSNAFQPLHEQFTRLVIKLSLITLKLSYIDDTKIYFLVCIKRHWFMPRKVAEDIHHVAEWCCAIPPFDKSWQNQDCPVWGVRQLHLQVAQGLLLDCRLFLFERSWDHL